MWNPKILFVVSLILMNIVAIGQESDVGVFEVEADTTQLDSASQARRRAYLEQKEMLRRYTKLLKENPERLRDSLAEIRKRRQFDEAQKRIEDYRGNNQISELEEIDLTGAQLKDIPDFVYRANQIKVLVLDGNRINALPSKLTELENLERIYWRNNELGRERVKIPKLKEIKKLDISNNGLSKLPKAHKLKGLEELVLDGNEFKKLPLWRLRRIKGLKELEISQNPILLNRRWYWLAKDLSILKVNKSSLTSIHPSFYRLKGLQELQLQVNELDSLPEGISKLENLRKVSCYKNKLRDLPSDFYKLEKLSVVDLYYNELTKVPGEISNLDSLQILYLSFNKLYDLPMEIGDLSALQELYIHHNRISEIPQSISNLSKLRVLHFQDNYVPQFPSQILLLDSLVDLDISNTDITQIPAEIEKLELEAFYWKELDIDINSEGQAEFRGAIQRMMTKGVRVSPRIYEDE